VGSDHNRRYGVVHRKRRERVAKQVRSGEALCVRCGYLILPEAEWHLDHDDSGHGWLGPAHALCNMSAGGRLGRGRQLGGQVSAQPVGDDRWSRCWCGELFGRDPRCPVDEDDCREVKRLRASGGDPQVA
jgi:hypothetical protein